jgi:transcriptional regulator with XRE-family HTH domain
MASMTARVSRQEEARQRARAALAMIGRELRLARRQHGLSQEAVGRAVGMSHSKVGRVERTRAPSLPVADACALLAAVGLDLVLRTAPGGDPVRDAGHTALLARFRARLHSSLGWATEVPLPIPGDRRAWDALVRGKGWLVGVEAEMRPNDRQALERKIALKQRDGGVDHVILLLARSADTERFVRANAAEFRVRFPAGARETLAELRDGREPTGNAILVL